jgi:hypothetical protein
VPAWQCETNRVFLFFSFFSLLTQSFPFSNQTLCYESSFLKMKNLSWKSVCRLSRVGIHGGRTDAGIQIDPYLEVSHTETG